MARFGGDMIFIIEEQRQRDVLRVLDMSHGVAPMRERRRGVPPSAARMRDGCIDWQERTEPIHRRQQDGQRNAPGLRHTSQEVDACWTIASRARSTAGRSDRL